jgi:hypothetical protein
MVRAAYNFGIEYCLRTDYGQVFRVSGIGRSGKVGKYEYFRRGVLYADRVICRSFDFQAQGYT